jgi:hypothetical protein
MKMKKYVIIYKDNGKHKWAESDSLEILQSIFNKCSWIKEYKIIDTSNFKEAMDERWITTI